MNSRIQETESGIRKLSGHIPYLGAEGLGQMLDLGVIDIYKSSEMGSRTPGTNKSLLYLQKGKWKERIIASSENNGQAVILRRRAI